MLRAHVELYVVEWIPFEKLSVCAHIRPYYWRAIYFSNSRIPNSLLVNVILFPSVGATIMVLVLP